MGNSIYLGGGIKSAFCGGNVKEIWQGSNKIFGGGGDEPMPEGYEQVDYLENIDGGKIFTTNSSVYYKFSMKADDVYKIEGRFIENNTSYTARNIMFPSRALQFNCAKDGNFFLRGNISVNTTSNRNILNNYDGRPIDFFIYRKPNGNVDFSFEGTTLDTGYFYYDDGSFRSIWSMSALNIGSRFKYIKIYDNTETELKYNIIAARRKSDGAPACVETKTQTIFDLSSSVFKTSKDA